MSKKPSESYIIVGSGVFGTSTAYHLSREHRDVSVTLIDCSLSFPCPLAASYDENKVVRADYTSKFYCELAIEARKAWLNDPLYKTFYHQSGLVNMDDTGLGRKIIKNYEELQEPHECELFGPEEMRVRYDGLFADTQYAGVGAKDIFFNPISGWAEARLAVRAVIEEALKNGVKYVSGHVESLVFNNDGSCSGVKLRDAAKENILQADNVILCTGAGTAKLLADSAPTRRELQAEDRITAAAVVVGFFQLTPEKMQRFKDVPVFVHAIGDVRGEILPPTNDGLFKFCVDVSFKNTSLHLKSGEMISAPPDQPDQAQNDVSQTLQNECLRVVRGIFGKELANHKFDQFRICWDGFTPNQDFIISSHPKCGNLYIATGGSFHGWKFLPIIGEYVVDLLDGKLSEDLKQRWAWDRPQDGAAHETVIPRREMSDLYKASSAIS
ncbi:sarcosine oxidase-like protein [Bisporella sp. PMI_857]|nr:sarcosine oxidase-like protein [Bisporella sp. PMI_857]